MAPSDPPANALFDRRAWRAHRDRAARLARDGAGAVDFLHAEVSDRLIDRLDVVNRKFAVALDLGARDGGFARDGVDRELDDLRGISRSGKQIIAEMESGERARTGIQSLKIRYNRVFGYYIEISKSNLHAVPADYHRKQTIAGGERYITPALKEYEEKVLGADERILERELEIFEALRTAVAAESPRIQATARAPGHRSAKTPSCTL
jgi:DNA mismatch repair protein MutS